ncbi:hypothetical protein [Enterococcus gallinarum]|uniref:hypothetical protein n=1 Tax=Enterococcus gallinarum TaxID=1353 RepID=UPI0018A9BF5E|nr:hypothetical protein [Enterococcus gallinarum]
MRKIAVFPLNNNTYAIQQVLLKSKQNDFVGFLTDTTPTTEVKLMAESLGITSLRLIDKKEFITKNVETLLIIDDQGYDETIVSNLVSEVNSLGREAKVVPFLQEKYNLRNTEQISSIDSEMIDEVLSTIPLISIMGVGENTYKLETQLYIDNLFADYKVLNITPKGCSIDTKFVPIPRELYYETASLSTKIQLFKMYISKILIKHDYDLITLAIPGSITPHDTYFNELALVISSAMSIDINIVNIYSNFDNKYDILKFLDHMCKYKYNSDLNLFNIVPLCARYGEDVLGNLQDFYYIDIETQNSILRRSINNLKNYDYHIFTLNRDILKTPSKEFFLDILTDNLEIL